MRAAFALAAFFAAAFASAEIDKAKVYVAANAREPASVALARFYCGARGIPPENIVLLDIPENSGTVSRSVYFEKIEEPLFAALMKNGAVSASDMGFADSLGRRGLLLSRVNADFLVLCKGIPWGISDQPPLSKKINGLKTDEASVDSEISARFLPQKTFRGPVRNPAFGAAGGSWRAFGLVRTARLDGPTFADAENLVNSGLAAEKRGLRGRVYIDKSKRSKLGDGWLDAAAEILQKRGFEVSVDERPAMFGFGGRFDAPALYFGWYGTHPTGHFNLKNFSCADGMIGWHIYSFSARTLARPDYWTPMFAAKNAAATDGNVFEPYLSMTRNIAVFVKLVFEEGLLPAEASFASLPALGWQNVYLADPLYNPLKKPLSEQIADAEAGRVDSLSQYAIIRRANEIAASGGTERAVEYLSKFAGSLPDDTALRWRIIELSSGAEKIELAKKLFAKKIHKNAQYVGLSFELARLLSGAGFPDMALSHAEEVFKMPGSSLELRRHAAARAAAEAKLCGKTPSAGVLAELEKIELEKRQKEEARRRALEAKKTPPQKNK